MTDRSLPPNPMSLPRTADLPDREMGFTREAKRRLLKHGITTALMLAEVASRQSGQLKYVVPATSIKTCKSPRLKSPPFATNRWWSSIDD